MKRFLVFLLAPLIAAGVLGSVSGAQPRTLPSLDERLASYPQVTIRLTDERIEAPAAVAAGMTLLVEENATDDPGHAFILRVPDDVSDSALAEALAGPSAVEATPEWFWRADFLGNGDRAAIDRPAVALVNLIPGRYVVGDPYRPATEYAQIDVAEAASDAVTMPKLPEADIAAELFEMGFALPESISAGPQLWEVRNTGAMLHEIAIIPVPDGATSAEVEAAVAAELEAEWTGDTAAAREAIDALGENWADWTGLPVAGVGVLSPQGVSLAQIDLEPGTYGAVCYIPDPATDTPHLMMGMTQVFTVAANT